MLKLFANYDVPDYCVFGVDVACLCISIVLLVKILSNTKYQTNNTVLWIAWLSFWGMIFHTVYTLLTPEARTNQQDVTSLTAIEVTFSITFSVQRFFMGAIFWIFSISYYFAYKKMPVEKVIDGNRYFSFTDISQEQQNQTRNVGILVALLISVLTLLGEFSLYFAG